MYLLISGLVKKAAPVDVFGGGAVALLWGDSSVYKGGLGMVISICIFPEVTMH